MVLIVLEILITHYVIILQHLTFNLKPGLDSARSSLQNGQHEFFMFAKSVYFANMCISFETAREYNDLFII